jgi:frataxin-like iron-binding protein CyaY
MSSTTNNTILTLDCLEAQILEGDFNCVMDVERLGADTLKITYKEKIYLLNARTSIGQIWLSSPISGPSHFFYEKQIWQSLTGKKLYEMLSTELTQLLGINFKIEPKEQVSVCGKG